MFDTSDYVDVVRLPDGRLFVVVRKIKEVALGLQVDAIVAACERAEALCKRRTELETRFVSQRGAGVARADGNTLDRVLDAACSNIYGTCTRAEEGALAAPKKAAHAKRLRQACFPAGLAAVVQVSYEAQLAQLTRIAAELIKPEIKESLAALALDEEAQTLLDNLAAYEQAIKRAANQLSFKDVRALRDETHEALCLIVALTLATYPAPGAEREALLSPLKEQEDIVRQQRRAKQPRTDINPDTGDEEPVDPSLQEG